MRRIGIYTVLIWMLQVHMQAQTVTLDLETSIERAGESSLEAFRAKNIYQAGYWEYHAFKAERLPSLTLTMTPLQYRRDFTERYDFGDNIDIYREQRTLSSYGNLSVSQNVDLTGGVVFVDTELNYMRNFMNKTNSQFTSVPVRIGYYQSLFGFNAFKWEKKIEPLKYEKAKRQYLYAREEISEKVIVYFFDLAVSQALYRMALENVASADTLYYIGQERHKIAAIPQADLLTLKLDAVNARNTLKNTEIEMKRAMFAFISFLNMEKDTEIILQLPERPRELMIAPEEALHYAQENNPDFLSYQEQILSAEREVDRTKKSSAFDAGLSMSVGYNQAGRDFRDAYNDPIRQDMVNITLTIPLIDWGVRKGKANMVLNNLNVARISVQQEEISLEQEIIMTVNDFNIQQDLISSAEEALSLANSAYESTKERYVIGKADINSLTLSLNRQKEAQTNYLAALKNYWLSYYRIRKLTLYDFERQKSLSYAFEELLNK
ncbi:MAG: TolC family protein [Candidatus Azobacteroides sp.]|nr:TolC family protein [Candidatus Azobacteroides sp.]